MTFDSDWDDDAEEELRAIEATYAAAKRKSSDFDREESSSSQRRRLPFWAKAASSSGSTTHDLCAGNGDVISKVDGFPCPFPRNGFCTFSPTPCQVNLKLRHPVFTFGGRTVYSRTSAEVEQATIEILEKIERLKHNANEISLGFDIEWKPIFVKGEAPRKTAVLQICMDSADCYVMHIIHSGVPPILKSLLEDPSSSKFLKPNKIRMGNWEANELSNEQLHYAATDAFASWYLYEVLKTFPDTKPET